MQFRELRAAALKMVEIFFVKTAMMVVKEIFRGKTFSPIVRRRRRRRNWMHSLKGRDRERKKVNSFFTPFLNSSSSSKWPNRVANSWSTWCNNFKNNFRSICFNRLILCTLRPITTTKRTRTILRLHLRRRLRILLPRRRPRRLLRLLRRRCNSCKFTSNSSFRNSNWCNNDYLWYIYIHPYTVSHWKAISGGKKDV